MDVVLSLPVFFGVAAATIVALVLLRRTRLFWLPGVALAGYGILIYRVWPWFDTHEDVGGLEGLSNLLHVAVTVVVVIGGVVLVWIGARTRRQAAARALPTAVVRR